jgi:protein SDA1
MYVTVRKFILLAYVEKVFAVLKKSTEHFDVRLMMMNFISRLIGHHKLMVENFYPFLQNYLNPKQERILICLKIVD